MPTVNRQHRLGVGPAADYLHVHDNTVRRNKEQIGYERIGGKLFFRISDLDRFAEARRSVFHPTKAAPLTARRILSLKRKLFGEVAE